MGEARGTEMGVGSSVELRDLTAVAAETMDVFAEFYSKEYALQLVSRLERGDLDTIKCAKTWRFRFESDMFCGVIQACSPPLMIDCRYSMVYPPSELMSSGKVSPNFRW